MKSAPSVSELADGAKSTLDDLFSRLQSARSRAFGGGEPNTTEGKCPTAVSTLADTVNQVRDKSEQCLKATLDLCERLGI